MVAETHKRGKNIYRKNTHEQHILPQIAITKVMGTRDSKEEGRKGARIDVGDGNKPELHVYTRLHIHTLFTVMQIADASNEKKRMRHDEGDEIKWAGANATTGTGDTAKPTAMEVHEAMRQCWQEKTQWPETDDILQVLGPENHEQLSAMQASIGTVLGRLREMYISHDK